MFLYEQYTSFLQDQRPLLQTGWLRFLLNGLQLFIEATHSNNTSLSLSVEPDSVCVCVSVCVKGEGRVFEAKFTALRPTFANLRSSSTWDVPVEDREHDPRRGKP